MIAAAFALVLAQLQPLPKELIALDSEEGRKLLVESQANRDFFALAGQFTTQKSTSFCGVASAVTVLNALPIEAPVAKEWAPFRAFTQDNVFDAVRSVVPPEHVEKGGLTVEQFGHLVRGNHVEATLRYASDGSLEAFRKEAIENLAREGDFVVVDFLRAELGQDTGAHWSPIAAYHEGTDRFLMLDVARFRYAPSWIPANLLWNAMNTNDPDSGKSRGYVLLSPAKGAPPRAEIAPVGHKLFYVAGAALSLAFIVGAALGALVTRWRLKRSAA